jgi:hypothetical protein
MKNQYFGDINDYRKYSLIRQLSGSGKLTTSVCWMLTPNDLNSDGHRIQYLNIPSLWRQYDSEVFDFLQHQLLVKKQRDVKSIERSKLISNCRYFSSTISDDKQQRKTYLSNYQISSSDADLIFFDPDNGVEVKSVPFGGRKSSKYVYYPEIKDFYQKGKSILVYQHLPPKPRLPLAQTITNNLKNILQINTVYLYWTQFVLFILIPQEKHKRIFLKNNEGILSSWNSQFKIERT